MKKKMFHLLLAVSMWLTLMLAMGTTAAAAGTTEWYTKNTGATEFTISTADDLLGLSEMVNGGVTFQGKTIKLVNDIDLNQVAFTPIGNYSTAGAKHPFKGTFDGNGKTISVLSIVNNGLLEAGTGLFGYVNDGTVKNLTVTGNIALSTGTSVGGIVGYLDGGFVINCVNYANVTGKLFVGGIVGDSQGAVMECVNYGTITGYMQVGGIVGYQEKYMILNCVNDGKIVGQDIKEKGKVVTITLKNGSIGGVVGESKATVTNCLNAGTVNGNGTLSSGVAGIAGTSTTEATFTNCVNTGSITVGNKNGGAIVGLNYKPKGGNVSNCYYSSNSGQAGTGTSKSPTELHSQGFVDAMNASVNKANANANTIFKLCPWTLEKGTLTLKLHKHLWSYTVKDGDTLVATCTGVVTTDSCSAPASLPLTLSVANTSVEYTGDSVEAKLKSTDVSAWEQYGVTVPTIQYSGRDGTSYDSTDAPSDAGKYTASIKADGKTASVNFEITKQTMRETPTVSMDDYHYGETPSTPTNSAGVTDGVTYYYNTTESKEGAMPWDSTLTLTCGTYYIYAECTDSTNVDDFTTDFVSFRVIHAYSIEVSDTQDSLVATCANTDQCEEDVRIITMKTPDAVYDAQPYEPDGVALFEKESGRTVTVTYYEVVEGTENLLSEAPTNAGSYKSILTVGEVSVTNNFQITPKPIAKPIAGTATYTYNTEAQTYSFESFKKNSGYSITSKSDLLTQTNAGRYTIVVALDDKQNTAWADGSIEDLEFTFLIGGVTNRACKIVVSKAENGTVTASHDTAYTGTGITLTVTPDKGYVLDTLLVKDENGNRVAVDAKGKGESYSFYMPSKNVTVFATFVEKIVTPPPFVDVQASDYYYDAVLWAREKGITSGVDATRFAPTAITTRAQMVTFLWRASGSPEPSIRTSFDDVVAGSYYEKAVLWAVEQGITKGTGNGCFSPDATVTRGQTVALLARMDGVKDEGASAIHSFADVSATDYYNNAVAWAVSQSITKGTSETAFSPNDDCTRGQIVTFLYRDFVQ